MRRRGEKGQALVMAAVALGIILIGAVGLAVDTAQLYAHRQMAQAAADAAAQAAILSIFNATNVGTNAFAADTGYVLESCPGSDPVTHKITPSPCAYAAMNGFGAAEGDTVRVDVPTALEAGIDEGLLSTEDPVNLIRVTITRHVSTTFIRMVGAAPTADIKVDAVAAILGMTAATPILVTHPTLPGALDTNGSTAIVICGGPSQSIQVNSSSPTALVAGGTIDLRHAGTADPGDCTTGTGADLGVFGGPVRAPDNPPPGVLLGIGRYVSPHSVILDPLAKVMNPKATALKASPPLAAPAPFTTHVGDTPNYGCAYADCTVYSPGLYTVANKLSVDSGNPNPIIFKPGLYYMQGGGLKLKNVNGGGGQANNFNAMCTTCAADPETGMGMVVFDTSVPGDHVTGGIEINPKGNCNTPPCTGGITLQGSTLTKTVSGHNVPDKPYYNLLFWVDSAADAHTGPGPTANGRAHSMGQGGGCLTLVGTIYATNPRDTMFNTPAHYQEVDYNGNPCSTTVQQGYIVVSQLKIVGSSAIHMKLLPYGFLGVRRVALVR